jgi:hypothetical protein
VKKRAAVLLVFGLFQMAGDLLDLHGLKRLGKAIAIAPAPKVFCAVDGYEAYSTQFSLEWLDCAGDRHCRPLTSDTVDRLRGPYNRRNVYGAALAYGPILPEQLRGPVLRYALSGDAPMLREMGIDPGGVRQVWIRYEPLPGTAPRDYPRRLGPEAP